MERFATLKKFRWRSMTEQELADLKDWLALRRQILAAPPAEEGFVMPPLPEGAHTAEGACYWALVVLWQDSPWLLTLGSIALVSKLVVEVWRAVRIVLG